MNRKPRRLMSALLAAALAAGLFAATPITAGAANANALKATIDGFAPGGTGTLAATVSGSTVTVTNASAATVVTSATNKLALNIDSGVTVVWKAIYTGARGDELIYLAGSGTFEVASGGYITNTSDGIAIFASSAGTTVIVSGGSVEGVGSAISTQADNSAVKVTGGTIVSKVGAPIYVTGADSSVEVGGGRVSCVGDYLNAIFVHPSSANTTVNVSGGFVINYDKDGNGAIRMLNGKSPTIGGTAVVVDWARPSGTPAYDESSTDDLEVAPAGATAAWGYFGSASGILYKNGANSGFFKVAEATVNEDVPGTHGPFMATEHPVGDTYMLNDVATALSATFEYGSGAAAGAPGMIDSTAPITARWYWSYDDSNTSRANGFAESTVDYGREIKYTTTHVPATDEVGVKYYYAVLSYKEQVLGALTNAQSRSEPREAVSDPARIEVVAPAAPTPTPTPAPTDAERSFDAKKTDGDGNPLSGAVLSLVPDSAYTQGPSVVSHEATTSNGSASFTASAGYYILSEKQAPTGYNATDDKYYIQVASGGVFLVDPATKAQTPYSAVTFVNKEIPKLDKDNHFAFMQGYPEGDFRADSNMTRAEAVVMFARLLSKKMDESEDHRNSYYPDVPRGEWYANQVGFMQEEGVLADFSRDGRFRGDDQVTRAEFATLAAHFDNLEQTDTNRFPDVAASHWAVGYINSSAAKGWVTGYPDGTFGPENKITRAEVVTLVGRMLERAADSAYLAANASSLPRKYFDLDTSHWAYLMVMEASTGHDYTKDGGSERWTSVYQ